MDKPAAGLRKRQQISQANKMMFLWIAGISVIVGISVVLTVFLGQKILFGEKVINEKNKTVSTLDKNLSKVDALRDNVRVLNTDKDLATTRLNDSDSPLQSVLDALPADVNSTSLASSLQTKILTGVPGIVVESINVDPVNGIETTNSSDTSSSSGKSGSNQISFTFAVSAELTNYSSLRQVMERLEKSIRPFNADSVVIETQGKRVVMTVKGESYYDSAKTIQLTQKVVKP